MVFEKHHSEKLTNAVELAVSDLFDQVAIEFPFLNHGECADNLADVAQNAMYNLGASWIENNIPWYKNCFGLNFNLGIDLPSHFEDISCESEDCPRFEYKHEGAIFQLLIEHEDIEKRAVPTLLRYALEVTYNCITRNVISTDDPKEIMTEISLDTLADHFTFICLDKVKDPEPEHYFFIGYTVDFEPKTSTIKAANSDAAIKQVIDSVKSDLEKTGVNPIGTDIAFTRVIDYGTSLPETVGKSFIYTFEEE